MRVRIIKPLAGVIDGVSLAALKAGSLYELEETLARYLVGLGGAEESFPTRPALIKAIDDPYIAHVTGGITVSQRETAADLPPRKRKHR